MLKVFILKIKSFRERWLTRGKLYFELCVSSCHDL